MTELPKVYRSALEAYAAADQLRTEDDNRPLQVLPLSNGQAVLKEYESNGQEDQHD